MRAAPADILLLFTQFFQFLPIRDLYRSARQLHHAFVLEIAKHAGNNLTGITHVVANDLMGGLQFVRAFDGCFLQQESRQTLVNALPHDLLDKPHDVGKPCRHDFVGKVGQRCRFIHELLVGISRNHPFIVFVSADSR